MLKPHSVTRSFRYCGWKSPSVFCTLILLASCNGGGSSGGGGGVIVTTAPSAPSSLSLVTPGSSPGLDSTPTISVGGVVNGNTVKLFSDSACATPEIGSAVSYGTSVNITVNSALLVSSHTIYANATNAIGTSPCSSLSVSYELATCPANFIPVPHNSSVETTSDFCVMKYEAKNNGSGVAVSQAAENPYVNLTIGASQTKCTSLGAKYDLISNPEWMTIARNAEGVGANWEAGTSGSGAMFRGHSDNSPASALAAAPDNDPYNGTGNTDSEAMGSGKEQKRTLTLSNGEVIWDLSGNAWEWVDWSHTTAGLQLGPITCVTADWTELPNVNCPELSSSPYMPFITNLSSTNGVGQFYGGSGGAALRGGYWVYGSYAGAFALYLNASTAGSYTHVGFRCVYRP